MSLRRSGELEVNTDSIELVDSADVVLVFLDPPNDYHFVNNVCIVKT